MLTYPVELDGQNFALSLHLHPYFVHASSEGSSERDCAYADISADVPQPSLFADVIRLVLNTMNWPIHV